MNTEDERVVANPRENYPAEEYLERPAVEAEGPVEPAADPYEERPAVEAEGPVEPAADPYEERPAVEAEGPVEPAADPYEGGSMDFNEPFQVEGYQEEEDPFEYIATTDAVSDALIRTEFGGRIAGAEEPPLTSTDYLDKVTSLDSMVMPTPQAPLATPQGSGIDWSFLTQPPQNVMATPKEEVPGAFDIDGYLKNNVYSNIQDSVSFTPEDDYDLPADIETAEKSYQKFKADNPEEAQNIDPRAFFVGSKRLKSQVNKDNRKALLTAMNMAAASGSPYAKYKNRVLADMFGFKEEMEPAVQVRPNPLTMDPRSYRMKADGTGLELDPLVQPTITTELDKKVPTGKYIDPQTVKDPLMRILYKMGSNKEK